MEAYLPRMISLLREELNKLLMKASPLGTDNSGKPIMNVPQSWIKEIDIIYNILDEEGKGSLDGDRIQFFLLSLILNELKEENRSEMPGLIRKQTATIMEHMH